jgi:acyl-CoA hydrolase
MKTKTPDESETIMTEIIFPNDTNPMGIVQGGRVVQLMDIASAICAQIHSGKIAVTASIDDVHFKQPAKLGDVLTVKARITRVFNSSMEIYAEVMAKRLPDMKSFLTNYAYFTFVALDENQKPCTISPVSPISLQDKLRYKEALIRRKKSKSKKHASVKIKKNAPA